jgi:hypothetical protein
MGFGCHGMVWYNFWFRLFAVNVEGKVNKYDSNSNTFLEYKDLGQASLDMRAQADYLVVTTLNSVYIHNKEMAVVRQINRDQITDSKPTYATVIKETIGTKGMITTSLASASSFENMTPSGPQRNNVFYTMQLHSMDFGDYTVDYNNYPLDME